MKRQEKCSVPHCDHTKHSGHPCKFHSFPKDSLSCKKWVQEVGNVALLQLSLKQLNKKRWVCSCHFEQSDYSSKGHLRRHVFPTQFDRTQVVALDDRVMSNFPPPDPAKPVDTMPEPLITLQTAPHFQFIDWHKIQSNSAEEPPAKRMCLSVHGQELTIIDAENITPPNAIAKVERIQERRPSIGYIMGCSDCMDHIAMVCRHLKSDNPNQCIHGAEVITFARTSLS